MKQQTTRPAPINIDPNAPMSLGRRYISGCWPSSRQGEGPWPMTVLDCGRVVTHTCPATDAGRSCWHEQGSHPDRLVLAYWHQHYGEMTQAQLRDRQNDLFSYCKVLDGQLEEDDASATLLELQAVTDLIHRQQTAAA